MTAANPPRERLLFVDALPGVALVLMVLNHTGRWWQTGHMTWPRYYLIYVTLTLAAPIFLFLVGFSVALSTSRTESAGAALGKGALRGVRIILAGLLLNLLVFPEGPISNNGVLQTIGLAILVATPAALLVRWRGAQWGLLALAAAGYLLFWWRFPSLLEWVSAHPVSSRVFFFEFPPWPWLSLVLVGLVLGGWWVQQPDAGARARYLWTMAAAGLACLVWFFGWDWWAGTPNRWMMTRDFILNNHWTPRGATLAWIMGTLFCELALFYWLVEILKMPSRWLVILGQTALFLYFTHHFIVFTLFKQRLGVAFNDWWHFAFANLALILLLLAMGRGWQEVKRLWRDRWQETLLALSGFRRA